MNRLKNITRSLVIVPDAKLRLAPGESAEVAELTPQCLAALRNGCVAKVDPPKVAEEPADEELPAPTSDARPAAAAASEPANRGGKKDRREAKEPQGEDVLDAMKARLAEASSAGS